MSKIRSFLAIELPPTIAKGIERVQYDLKQSHADVRWIESNRIHLTLKFFGDIEEEACDGIMDAVGKAVTDVKPFTLTIKGLGGFPRWKNPRVVWLGVEDEDGVLKPLQGVIEKGLGEIGYPQEERAFKPHLTLGRVRSPKGKPELLKKMEGFLHVELGKFRVERLVLFKSDLRPTGPIYTALKTLTLRGG